MSLLRPHSSGDTQSEEDEQPAAEAPAGETAGPSGSPVSGTARYAYGTAPADGSEDDYEDATGAGTAAGTAQVGTAAEDGTPAGDGPAGASDADFDPHAVPAPAPATVPTPVPGQRAAADSGAAGAAPAYSETTDTEPAYNETAGTQAAYSGAADAAPTFTPTADAAAAGGVQPTGMTPATAQGLDGPLLSDAAELQSRWQRVQAGFVDDPQRAVGDAADLVEQTAQAMVETLRQRQQQLRTMWERGPADGGQAAPDGTPAAAAPGASDTEHLRQLMQRYRSLFHQLSRP